MFFFFFPQNRLSTGEEQFLQDNSGLVVDRLLLVGEAKGIKNPDIINLTRWSPSKVSKLVKKNQKLSLDDLKNWAKCLGYTPEVFLKQNFDIREYCLSDSVRDLRTLFDAIAQQKGTVEEVSKLHDLVSYEFPLSALSALGVEPSEFIGNGRINYLAQDVFAKEEPEYCDDGIAVLFRHKNVALDTRAFFEYVFSPDRKYAVLGLFDCPIHGELGNATRMKEKDIVLADTYATVEFDDLARTATKWIPNSLQNGEVSSFIYDMSNLPDNDVLVANLEEIYERYCDLIYAKTNGADIKRRKLNIISESSDNSRSLDGKSPFERSVTQKVLLHRGNVCEIDPSHSSFFDQDDNPFMYLDSLIPVDGAAEYGDGIKGEANCICLCPLCHAQFIHGKKEDRERMVFELYRKHEADLKNAGVDITLSEVLKRNGL